jgi:uncharacterized membrane protein YjjP (DUF1212 family)
MNVNMSAVAAINQLVGAMEEGRCGLADARKELEDIEHRSPAYGRWIVVFVLGLTRPV